MLALLTAGCAGQPDSASPSAGTPEVLGRTFLSTSVSGHALAEGTRISLMFPEKGKISANAGCNHLFGDVTFEGGRMKVSDMGGTDMACDKPRMDQDDWFIKFVTAGPAYTLTGNDLVLKGDSTEIKLQDREVADPDRPLAGRRWTVDSLLDSESASSVPQGAQAYLEFQGDKVTGNTGCNSLGGTFSQQDKTITFSNVATTKMACPGPEGQLERAVVGVLDGTVDYTIEANRLVLKHPSGRGLQLTS
ncbi:META domain-containing protein [Allorhizocola rhizosphaerae]|uniref:META domain-containing protein n=1 Tax=Allorhizocola rhizosphaerae TaxID=1872709 RepID=UPI0013C2C9E6|nr:META domain-containing protein [Allorhizocola rhizosphaerae]